MSEILVVDIEKLDRAPWNYKSEGPEERIKTLMNSIIQDDSAGVLAVRVKPDGRYEVLDGNHRLVALQRLGRKVVNVESFGAITKAQAVLLARRRNFSWFEDDNVKLADLLRNDVLAEMPLESFLPYMPDSKADILNLIALTDFDWQKPGKEQSPNGYRTLKVLVSEEVWTLWLEWIARVEGIVGEKPADSTAFEYALAEALASDKENEKVGKKPDNEE